MQSSRWTVLENPNGHLGALNFQLTAQLAGMLRKRLPSIEDACSYADRTVKELLAELSARVLIKPRDYPTDKTLYEWTKATVRNLNSYVTILGSQHPNSAQAAVLSEIASELELAPYSATQCGSEVEFWLQRAKLHLESLVSCWGGERAKARIGTCRELVLDVKLSGAALYMCTDRKNGRIELTIGSEPLLLAAFFDLEYMFLHEYLSHEFHTWDNKCEALLAEGYLKGVAHLFLTERPDLAHRPEDFDNRFLDRLLQDEKSKEAKGMNATHELYRQARDPFLSFLLDWAVEAPSNPDEALTLMRLLFANVKGAAARRIFRQKDGQYAGFDTCLAGLRDHSRATDIRWKQKVKKA